MLRLPSVHGGELVFRYKPGSDFGRVLSAFERFCDEMYALAAYKLLTRAYDSGRVRLVFVVSGGNTLDWIALHFSDCGENTCKVVFIVVGTNKRSGEDEFDRVKKFFVERSRQLLKVERWGGSPEAPKEGIARHICQDCGSVIGESRASYCWHCGAAQTSRAGEGSSIGPVRNAKLVDSRRLARACMICKLGFEEGDLLAWCPFCGAASHRLHLLEFLHVKKNCPACGHDLKEQDLSGQLGRANLRLPRKPRQ